MRPSPFVSSSQGVAIACALALRFLAQRMNEHINITFAIYLFGIIFVGE